MAGQTLFASLLCAVIVCSSIVWCQVSSSRCQRVSDITGFISDSGSYYQPIDNCWIITVLQNTYTSITIERLETSQSNCAYQKLTVRVIGSEQTNTFCSPNSIRQKPPIIAFNDVEVRQTMVNVGYNQQFNFKLSYESVNIACDEKGRFKCSSEMCIPNAKVCDGVDDCPNRADELICELDLKGIFDTRRSAVRWLMDRRSPTFGWRDNTHRAVIAMYLASQTANSTKNEKGLIDSHSTGYAWGNSSTEEELILRHLDLQTSLALLKRGTHKMSVNQLSMFVNALVVSCQDPRHFYGFNLVQMLKERMSSNILNLPVAYLALCNADEPLPDNATDNLDELLRSTAKYPFLLDVQASAVMAATCLNLRSEENEFNQSNSSLGQSLEDTLSKFRALQQEDGTFGNIYTTALITQALLSSGKYISGDWRLKSAVQYLMQQINSTSTDFLAVYLTLPLLNWRTLADVRKTNCSGSSKPDPVTIADQTLGPKMRLKYSLFVGDEKDVIHTLSLRVPHNISAFEVMQLAQAADAKYKFQWKQTGDQKYVYEIANIINDSENGLFWLLYVADKNGNSTHSLQSPEEVTMHRDEHLIMWYKTADI